MSLRAATANAALKRRPWPLVVIDQYLLRRRDGSLELWCTDELGVSWCARHWVLVEAVGHSFLGKGCWTTVRGAMGDTVVPGYAPEAHEDGGCDCQHGCRFGR